MPVGLGTDIAGGYSIDIMNAMRQAVIVSRMREGTRVIAKAHSPASSIKKNEDRPLSIDWKEALYLATTGGAAALGLPEGVGTFAVGVPFDAQSSEFLDGGFIISGPHSMPPRQLCCMARMRSAPLKALGS